MLPRRAAIAASALVLALARAAAAGGGPAETVVLVNRESADSRRVAERYVAARNVPPQQVCEVGNATSCPRCSSTRVAAMPARG